MRSRVFVTIVASWLAMVGNPVRADDKPAPDAKAAFERMKSLAGTWNLTSPDFPAGEPPQKVVYRVTAGGSALVEELFAGTPHEMVSVYHLDGDKLVMTHYCAQGNQPRQQYDAGASAANTLFFAFSGGANINPEKDSHMHESKYIFKDEKHVDAFWTGFADGKPAGTHAVSLTRP